MLRFRFVSDQVLRTTDNQEIKNLLWLLVLRSDVEPQIWQWLAFQRRRGSYGPYRLLIRALI